MSLARMAAIEAPDRDSGSVLVEAGVVLARLHQGLAGSGLTFPLPLGAEGSTQIGGLAGTNAGGSHAFRYGMMQDLVLGLGGGSGRWLRLERVAGRPEGQCGLSAAPPVLWVRRHFRRRHPCGSETGCRTRYRATALLSMTDLASTVCFETLLRSEAAELLEAAEFFSDIGISFALRHIKGLSFPLATRSDSYLLLDLAATSSLIPLDDILSKLLERGIEEGLVLDGSIAASLSQRAAFWRLREVQPEAQRLEGAQLKHDIAVPPGQIAAFVAQASALCEAALPGIRVNPFGHLGDGNIHFNLSPVLGQTGFGGQDAAIGPAVAKLATDMGGSFAAEHGLGRSKVVLADALRPESEHQIMRQIKMALDPDGRLNPGVILRD